MKEIMDKAKKVAVPGSVLIALIVVNALTPYALPAVSAVLAVFLILGAEVRDDGFVIPVKLPKSNDEQEGAMSIATIAAFSMVASLVISPLAGPVLVIATLFATNPKGGLTAVIDNLNKVIKVLEEEVKKKKALKASKSKEAAATEVETASESKEKTE